MDLLQNGETVFITGVGMKNKTHLICGLVCIGLGFGLSIIFSSILQGGSVLFWGAIVWGIAYLVWYFKFQKMNITVTNFRIMGRCIYRKSISIPLQFVNAVQVESNGNLKIMFINNGKQDTVFFPKMENTEQIYNAIYSLVFAPPPVQR